MKDLRKVWRDLPATAKVAVIVVAGSIVVAVLNWVPPLLKKGSPEISQTQKQSSGSVQAIANNSPGATQVSQSASTSVVQASQVSSESAMQAILANSQGAIQTAISIPKESGPVTINNYYTPDSDTKKALAVLASIQGRLTGTETNVAVTREELRLLAKALQDLDERTAGMGKLPDGRTRYVGIIGGAPSIVVAEDDLARSNGVAGHYEVALQHAQNAIKAYEAAKNIETTDKDLLQVAGTLQPPYVNAMYVRAAAIAHFVAFITKDNHYKELQYDYATKARAATNTASSNYLLALAAFVLGKHDEATNAIAQAVQQDPSNAEYVKIRDLDFAYMLQAEKR